jgi:hypothetical protein
MGSIRSWLSETFNSTATENDLIKARALNSTRISAIVLPVLTGVVTAVSEVTDKPPFNDPAFQRVLVVVLVAFLAVVLSADILGRSWVASRQQPQVRALGTQLAATATDGVDEAGTAVAVRSTGGTLEFLFVPPSGAPSWIAAEKLHFPQPTPAAPPEPAAEPAAAATQ